MVGANACHGRAELIVIVKAGHDFMCELDIKPKSSADDVVVHRHPLL